MCTEPVLLCLDEPAAGLNPNESAELGRYLHTIRDEHDTSHAGWRDPDVDQCCARGARTVDRQVPSGELVVHCAYWKYTVRRRITGEKRGSFPLDGSNWFRREAKDGAARWKADVAGADEIHRRCGRRSSASRATMGEKVKGSRWTYRDIVASVAAHDLYHAGQMRLVRCSRGAELPNTSSGPVFG
jgi:hypothetical protein